MADRKRRLDVDGSSQYKKTKNEEIRKQVLQTRYINY